jgi:SAM-dependent methyltransferase
VYEKLSIYYDRFIDDELYDVYEEFIQKHYQEGTVIDLGTGTAPLPIRLAKKGFHVTGTDTSQEMLEESYNNAVDNNLHIRLFLHDIRDPLNQEYDVITMTSDVINYMNDLTEVKTVFENIYQVMNEDSIFIFDFLLPQFIKKLNHHHEEILVEDNLMIWNAETTNLPNQIKHTVSFGNEKEIHYQQTHMPKVYRALLKEVGLDVKRKKKTEERMIYLCKKL